MLYYVLYYIITILYFLIYLTHNTDNRKIPLSRYFCGATVHDACLLVRRKGRVRKITFVPRTMPSGVEKLRPSEDRFSEIIGACRGCSFII